MKNVEFVSRLKSFSVKRNEEEDRLLTRVAAKLRDRELFVEKTERARDFFRKLKVLPF